MGIPNLSEGFSSSTVGMLAFTAVFEIGMHIFIHFTAPGADFAAWIVDTLGISGSAMEAAGAVEMVADSGEEVMSFDMGGL